MKPNKYPSMPYESRIEAKLDEIIRKICEIASPQVKEPGESKVVINHEKIERERKEAEHLSHLSYEDQLQHYSFCNRCNPSLDQKSPEDGVIWVFSDNESKLSGVWLKPAPDTKESDFKEFELYIPKQAYDDLQSKLTVCIEALEKIKLSAECDLPMTQNFLEIAKEALGKVKA